MEPYKEEGKNKEIEDFMPKCGTLYPKEAGFSFYTDGEPAIEVLIMSFKKAIKTANKYKRKSEDADRSGSTFITYESFI